jgi:hypothetical protein
VSSVAKWLLITLLATILHAIYVVAIGVIIEPGSVAFVFPFGSLTASNAASFAGIEAFLAFILLIVFGVTLLRDPSN